jgi:hypothetical protein
VIVGGFFIGYFLLPRLFSSSDDDSDSAPMVLRRVRDHPAIEYSPSGDAFIVEGEMKQILSGAIHYFRVVPDYWEDRLMKLRAAGLNTVETYVTLIIGSSPLGSQKFNIIFLPSTLIIIFKRCAHSNTGDNIQEWGVNLKGRGNPCAPHPLNRSCKALSLCVLMMLYLSKFHTSSSIPLHVCAGI